MADVKQLRRVQTAAVIETQAGTPVIDLTKLEDGGEFALHPLTIDSNTLFLPHPEDAGYGVAIRGDAETLGRVGRALLSMERNANGGSDSDE